MNRKKESFYILPVGRALVPSAYYFAFPFLICILVAE